jgi:hypothetical protein
MSRCPESGVQSWTESMSARERIRAVAETLREPRSVNWISEQADAAWSTTNEELLDLVDQGQLRRVEAGKTTRSQPDHARLLFEEIRVLIEGAHARGASQRVGRGHGRARFCRVVRHAVRSFQPSVSSAFSNFSPESDLFE